MKAIELVQVDAVTQQVRTVEVLGHIKYIPDGRQFKWEGHHNGVSQYFATKPEAVQFASTGAVWKV